MNKGKIPLQVVEFKGKIMAVVDCLIMYNFKKVPAEFIIDTGASVTALSLKEAYRLDIVFESLPYYSKPVAGIGGTVSDTRVIKDVSLVFSDDEGKEVIFYLEEVPIYKPQKIKRKEIDRYDPEIKVKILEAYPNILGINVLRESILYIDFHNKEGYIILEGNI